MSKLLEKRLEILHILKLKMRGDTIKACTNKSIFEVTQEEFENMMFGSEFTQYSFNRLKDKYDSINW